jgi:hypothetical protein
MIISSCQNEIDCFDCYIDQFPKEQRDVIIDLHEAFENMLATNYPEYSTNEDKLRSYCKDLKSNPDFKELIDSIKILNLIERYKKSELEKEFRSWSSGHINYNGLYFRAQENCLKYDYQDSLVYYYLKTYEDAGDLSPSRFVEYIAFEADNTSLERKMLKHQFIMEYYVPRMMKRITLPNKK